MLFFVYHTTRHGPQNGFPLCLVQRGLHIASESKSDGDSEDDIDSWKKEIPRGHTQMVILGDLPVNEAD
ncbi:hypothetical protein F4680DRAFT_420033, partial [Xylaria scruposa]